MLIIYMYMYVPYVYIFIYIFIYMYAWRHTDVIGYFIYYLLFDYKLTS